MGILSWVVLGLVVGVLAKWLMPGNDPGGLIVTILIGVGGALVGGWAATALGFGGVTGLNLGSILVATGGAIVLLWGYRLLRRGQTKTPTDT
jgi:uncharacterized membrane protein YeaQ/YmgE (transglycosylase-associated protein family)